MSVETFLAVWGQLTPAAVVFMGLIAIIAALLAMMVSWLRPRWKSTTVVAATSLTAADTRPWWQFDKAEGFAAAYWFGAIIAPPALMLGVIGASCGVAIFRRLRVKR